MVVKRKRGRFSFCVVWGVSREGQRVGREGGGGEEREGEGRREREREREREDLYGTVRYCTSTVDTVYRIK